MIRRRLIVNGEQIFLPCFWGANTRCWLISSKLTVIWKLLNIPGGREESLRINDNDPTTKELYYKPAELGASTGSKKKSSNGREEFELVLSDPLTVTVNDATMSKKTSVTFVGLNRDSPGVVSSTEPSFVVLVNNGKLVWVNFYPLLGYSWSDSCQRENNKRLFRPFITKTFTS